jgi:hypothetical protein
MTKFVTGLPMKPGEVAATPLPQHQRVKKTRKPKFQTQAHTKDRNDHYYRNNSPEAARAAAAEARRRQGERDD